MLEGICHDNELQYVLTFPPRESKKVKPCYKKPNNHNSFKR